MSDTMTAPSGPIAAISVTPDICRTFGERMYSSPMETIWTRETFQNSRDARARNIHFSSKTVRGSELRRELPNGDATTLKDSEHYYVMECADDGTGMSAKQFVEAFLKIGGSDKSDSGDDPIGGFGIAMLVILAGDHWQVISKRQGQEEIYCDSTMMGRSISIGETNYLAGQKSGTIVRLYRSKYVSTRNMKKVLELSRLTGLTVTLNGEMPQAVRIGRVISQFKFGDITANKSDDRYPGFHVRVGGIFQFSHSLYGVTQVCCFGDFEVDKIPSVKMDEYPFDSSRESLKWNYRSDVEAEIHRLITDTTSALKEHEPDLFVEVFSDREMNELAAYFGEATAIQDVDDYQQTQPIGGYNHVTGNPVIVGGIPISVTDPTLVSSSNSVSAGNTTGLHNPSTEGASTPYVAPPGVVFVQNSYADNCDEVTFALKNLGVEFATDNVTDSSEIECKRQEAGQSVSKRVSVRRQFSVGGVADQQEASPLNFPFVTFRSKESQKAQRPETVRANRRVLRMMRMMLDFLGYKDVGVGFLCADKSVDGMYHTIGNVGIIAYRPRAINVSDRREFFIRVVTLLAHELTHHEGYMAHDQSFLMAYEGRLEDMLIAKYGMLWSIFCNMD